MEYVFSNELVKPPSIIKRLLAFIIDLLVFNIAFFNVFMISFKLTSGFRNELLTTTYLSAHPQIVGELLGVLTTASVIFCFYLSLSEYYYNFSVGEYLMNIRISEFKSINQLIIRNSIRSTLLLLLPIDLIGLLLFNERISDRLLGIKVLYNNNLRFVEEL